ncbi:MAG: LysR family transcriptional regulator [Proteobacteria bacterium]|nr:LysR family transcriptional regulator [Pseudomonadota bacterium]
MVVFMGPDVKGAAGGEENTLNVASLYEKSIEMELRHLRYFLAVAEELNFTRAARRLNMAQPPLTQQIKALEAEMGVTLFDRTGYRVELTDAGRSFMPQVMRILGDVRNAVAIAQRAAAGEVGQVRVGFTESASFNPLVTAAFRNFRVGYPEVEMSLEESPSTVLANALRDGRIDAAFLRPPLRSDEGVTLHLIDEEEMVVAVPSSHTLAQRTDLEIRDLAEETFVLYPRAERPGLADTVIAACEKAGFAPKVKQYTPQLSSTINLVAASLGISIVPQSMRGLQPEAVTYKRLRGLKLTALLGIAHRTGEASAPILRFIETARASRAVS